MPIAPLDSPKAGTKPQRFFLAIRHNPSGGFLPAIRGYGFTREEPCLDRPPRLFEKPGPTRQALARWLEGELFEGSFNEEGGQIDLRLIKRPDRRASEMEIVEIELVVRTLSEAKLRNL